MNRQTAQQAQKETTLRKKKPLFQNHAAVRSVADHEQPINGSAGGFAVDLTSVPVRPQAQVTGRDTTRSCPMSPQRCPFGGACHSCPPRVQAKLKIGQPGDKYEQEADRVAEQVMRMPEPSVQRKGCSSPGCKEEDEDKVLQAKSVGSAGNVGSQTVDHPLIQNVLSSPGQPLDAGTRSFMEPRFGQDFSRVRVHTDGKAAESARAVNARAYTVGRDVVFGEGRYAPGSDERRRLVAHELVHVGQQSMEPQFQQHLKVGHHVSTEAPYFLQRDCSSTEIDSVGGCISIVGQDIMDLAISSEFLYLFNVNCDTFQSGEESRLRGFAGSISQGQAIEIHGFSSEEGDPLFNENLSCARAHAVNDIFNQEGVRSYVRLFRHGATPGSRTEHRSVVIVIPEAAQSEVMDTVPSENQSDSCRDHMSTCEFYLCRDRKYPCGDEGYYKGYGYKYCKLFNTETKSKLSDKGKIWVDNVTICLQKFIENKVLYNTSCDEVKDKAFDSHPDCYTHSGLCELPVSDLIKIFLTVDILDSIFSESGLKQAILTGNTCMEKLDLIDWDALQHLGNTGNKFAL